MVPISGEYVELHDLAKRVPAWFRQFFRELADAIQKGAICPALALRALREEAYSIARAQFERVRDLGRVVPYEEYHRSLVHQLGSWKSLVEAYNTPQGVLEQLDRMLREEEADGELVDLGPR